MNHDNLDLKKLDIPYLETTKFGDYIINIENDDDGESPREWDNITTMVCWHRNYNLGDKHDYECSIDFYHQLSGLYPDMDYEYLTDNQIERCVDVANSKNVILSLYLYDHSGITMSTTAFSCHWDSGQVGVIFISHETIRKEYNVKRVSAKMRERMFKYLESDVTVYDQYLTGDVYWFNIEKKDEYGDIVDIDSCSGFYGQDDNYMVEVIKDAIAYDIKQSPQQTEMF